MVRIGMDTQIGRRGYLNWAAAWPRVLTPSLRRIADTRWSILFLYRKSRPAISADESEILDRPLLAARSARSPLTPRSRSRRETTSARVRS